MRNEAEKYLKRELLYRGLNGREVYRVYVNDKESYILKPFSSRSQEVWVYEHILPAFPPIYPRLIDYSTSSLSDSNEEGWLLFEDLGQLQHQYEEAQAQEVVCLMAWWHTLPSEEWQQAALTGQKPTYSDMLRDLLRCKSEVLSLATSNNIDCTLILELFDRVGEEKLSDELVISHGDLHVGNYCFAHEQLFILDWEHVHLSHRYWDLYHLIDLSHPLYPKSHIPGWRTSLLDLYLKETMQFDPKLEPRRFLYEYNLFASVFSLWLLRLIEADRMNNNSPWSDDQLLMQAIETTNSFNQTVKACL